MGSGVIISETTPELINRYTWIKPMPDGSEERYERSDGGWVLVSTVPAKVNASAGTATNLTLDGWLKANNGKKGRNKTITVDGVQLKFKNGLLIEVDGEEE